MWCRRCSAPSTASSRSIKLTLDVDNRLTVQKRLLDNEVDMAVMGLIEDTHDLEVAQFVPNELVVIAVATTPHWPSAATSRWRSWATRRFCCARRDRGRVSIRNGIFEGRDLKLNVGDGAAEQRRDQAGRGG